MRQILNSEAAALCRITDNRKLTGYSLGGLMYTPAHNRKVSDFLVSRRYSHLRSLALCLEDAIADGSEDEAIHQTAETFRELRKALGSGIITKDDFPCIFVRVRSPEQIMSVYEASEDCGLLTGIIFPKFDETNAEDYLEAVSKINKNADNILYGMPILESRTISDIRTRTSSLSAVRDITDAYRDIVLNIRIGGNDFCSGFGVRRRVTDSIYNIVSVASVISDIVSVFADDYIVSAPVWDYFEGPDPSDRAWADGLRNEIQLDIINGLTGKTAIHPSQLEVIDRALAVSENDYRDACDILCWEDCRLAVSKGAAGNRMNEFKVHRNWAEKIIIRAAVYGIDK